MQRKIIVLCGPRACGKTTLARHITGTLPNRIVDHDESQLRTKSGIAALRREALLVICAECYHPSPRGVLLSHGQTHHAAFSALARGADLYVWNLSR